MSRKPIDRRKAAVPAVPVMTADGPPAAVLAAAKKNGAPGPKADKLDQLKKMVAKVRELDFEVKQRNEATKEIQDRITLARTDAIPKFMEENRIPAITLGAEGNYPEVTCEVKPFFSANIKADWEEEKRAAAFAYLEKIGEGDLIKTSITYFFPRELAAATGPFMEAVGKLRIKMQIGKPKKGAKPVFKTVRPPTPSIEKGVPFQTLTAWLRRIYEAKKPLPDLDKIGGHIGTVAEIKVVKEK